MDGEVLDAEGLLAGTRAIHNLEVPAAVLDPAASRDTLPGVVRIHPVTVATLMLVSRAARDEPGLVPVLLVKEALVEPALSIDQVRSLSVGLLGFLLAAVNRISGLTADGDVLDEAADSAVGRTHLLLARHFGWSPDQVAALTPGQVAVYLAGVERFLDADEVRS
jgi:hypothetical protein